METPMTAIEMTGSRVRVIVLYPANGGDWDEAEWLQAAARNPVFDFLNDPAEDIYSPADGELFHDGQPCQPRKMSSRPKRTHDRLVRG